MPSWRNVSQHAASSLSSRLAARSWPKSGNFRAGSAEVVAGPDLVSTALWVAGGTAFDTDVCAVSTAGFAPAFFVSTAAWRCAMRDDGASASALPATPAATCAQLRPAAGGSAVGRDDTDWEDAWLEVVVCEATGLFTSGAG